MSGPAKGVVFNKTVTNQRTEMYASLVPEMRMHIGEATLLCIDANNVENGVNEGPAF
jgi:hypothetical protein